MRANWFAIQLMSHNPEWYQASFAHDTKDWPKFLAGFKACLQGSNRWIPLEKVWVVHVSELPDVRRWVDSQTFTFVLWCEPSLEAQIDEFILKVRSRLQQTVNHEVSDGRKFDKDDW